MLDWGSLRLAPVKTCYQVHAVKRYVYKELLYTKGFIVFSLINDLTGTTPSCSVKYNNTCDFSCAMCPIMVSPSLAWPDHSLHSGIITCNYPLQLSLALQVIMPLCDLGSDHPRLYVSPFMMVTVYTSSRLPLSCLR